MSYSGKPGLLVRLTNTLVLISATSALILLGMSGCQEKGAGLGKDVLATVNGEPVTVDEFRLFNEGEIPDKPGVRSDALDRLINNRLASRAAVEQGMLGTPAVLNGLEQFYNDRLPYFLKEKIVKDTTVTDEDLLAYRKGQTLKTVLGVSVLVAHTMDEAQAARAELAKGKGFKEVAAKYSTIKGGDVDTAINIDEATYPVGVRAVLNRMKPGELSPIMKLEIGYAVFRLNYHREPEQLWKAGEENARNEIRKGKAEAELARVIDRLRSSADLKLDKRVLPDGEVQYMGATVNGVEIRLDPSLFSQAGDPHSPHQRLNPKTLNDALNKRVNDVLLSQEARRIGLQNDPEFQKELKLKKEEILAGAISGKARGAYEPTQQDMKEYYEKNKDKYSVKPTARVSRILLATEAAAKEAMGRLKAGKSFAAVAKEMSVDGATKDKGGDVGYVKYELLKEPLKSALEKLNVGEVSGILKSDYGYEVLKLTDKKQGGPMPMSDISGTVKKRVKLVKESERVEAFYKTLHDKADIKINKKLLESLKG